MQLIYFFILIFSIILHEVAHGYAAELLGDPTARYAGRLTLNPLPHIDPLGSIILPLVSIIFPGGFFFGWAKPVPYNPYNFVRFRHYGEAIVAGAGPLTNILLAFAFSGLIRFSSDSDFVAICFIGVAVNVWLAILNLIPVPPLDGSKILPILLPGSWGRVYREWRLKMDFNPLLGLGAIALFFALFGNILSPAVYAIAKTIAGL